QQPKESMRLQTIRIEANLDGKTMRTANGLAWTRLALSRGLLKLVLRLFKPASNPFQTGVPLELTRSSPIPSRPANPCALTNPESFRVLTAVQSPVSNHQSPSAFPPDLQPSPPESTQLHQHLILEESGVFDLKAQLTRPDPITTLATAKFNHEARPC